MERGTGRDTLLCSVPVTENVDDNLCMKAARAFFAEMGTKSDGVTITLEKHIPVQAGLGGGSSDAAAALRALRTLYQQTPIAFSRSSCPMMSMGIVPGIWSSC